MTSSQRLPRPIFTFLGPLYVGLSGLSYPMIRFFTGIVLMPHGAQKLFGWFGGDINGTAAFFTKIQLEPAMTLAYAVGGIEFFGGLLLAIGFLTRPAAIGIAVVMAVAMFKVHMVNGFFWNQGGYEYPMLWGIIALALAFRGGGELSLDRAIGREF